MKILVDTHTHTISSGHAYSTLFENTIEANKKGLEAIAITDHAPAIVGAPHEVYFWNMRVIPEIMNNVRVLKGVEVNIMDFSGGLDLTNEFLTRLDFVNASYHEFTIDPGTVEENTEGMINVLKNPFVDAVSHPGNPNYPVDIDKVVRAAGQYNKLIEINNGSFSVRKGSEANCLEFVKRCKKHGVRISCGSDAHICYDVGSFNHIYRLLEECDMPEDLVICSSINNTMRYIDERRARISALNK